VSAAPRLPSADIITVSRDCGAVDASTDEAEL
jgi:hypothetical protein